MYYNERMQIERDRKNITQNLPKICTILNISSDYIIGLTNIKNPYPRKK